MRHSLWLPTLFALLTLSCQNAANTQNNDIVQQQTVQQQNIDPESVILKSDDLMLTMDDYHLSIASRRLYGQIVTPRILANPRFQREEIQRCTQSLHLRKFAELNNIKITQAQRQEVLRNAFEKNGVQSEEKLCEKLDIASSDLDKVIEILALPKAVQHYLAYQIPDSEALKAYQVSHRRFNLELASFDNTPTVQEAAEFIVNHKDQFSKYLGAHPELVKTPPHAEFIRMAYTKSEQAPENARKLAETLRKFAIEKGTDNAIAQCIADAENGCTVLNDRSKLHEIERTDDTAWAFRLAEGDVPDVIHTSEHEEIWILQQVLAPENRNLKDPALQSLLAQKAMADTEPAPHLIEKLKPALEQPDASLTEFAKTQNAATLRGQDEVISACLHFYLVAQRYFNFDS